MVPLFFSSTTPPFGSLKHLSQMRIWTKTKLLPDEPDEKSHGLGTQRESRKKQNGLFSTISG